MTHASDLPAWAALVTSILLLVGAFLAFTGSLGLLRLRTFYERVHAPTLGTTLGIGSVLLASMLFFSVVQSRPVLHEVLIAVLMVVTTPVTLVTLARAALYRDRREGNDQVPARRSLLLGHPASPTDPAVALSKRSGPRTGLGDPSIAFRRIQVAPSTALGPVSQAMGTPRGPCKERCRNRSSM